MPSARGAAATAAGIADALKEEGAGVLASRGKAKDAVGGPSTAGGPPTAPAGKAASAPATAQPAAAEGASASTATVTPAASEAAAAAAAQRAKLNPDAPAFVPPAMTASAGVTTGKKGGKATANGDGGGARRRSRSGGGGGGAATPSATGAPTPSSAVAAPKPSAEPGDGGPSSAPSPEAAATDDRAAGTAAGPSSAPRHSSRDARTAGSGTDGRPPSATRGRAASRRKAAVQRALEAAGAVARTVYICDVDPAVTEAALAALFACCGAVVDCRVCGDPNSAMRFAFVEFRESASVEPALAQAGTVLGAYPIRVSRSKTAIVPVNRTYLPRDDSERARCGRTVYVANIDRRVGEADVRAFFEGLCGAVTRLRLLGDGKHAARIAFVEFGCADAARAALGCSGALLGGLPVRVSPSKTPVRIGPKEAAAAATAKAAVVAVAAGGEVVEGDGAPPAPPPGGAEPDGGAADAEEPAGNGDSAPSPPPDPPAEGGDGDGDGAAAAPAADGD